MSSEFVKNMGKSYIRPPVMRTNAILKNKNLNQCLALWQFIEDYEQAGYSMLVQENLEKVDDAYIKELYSTLAMQYLIFRYNIRNEFEYDETLASQLTDDVLNPRIVDELTAVKESEFDIVRNERTAEMPSVTRFKALEPDDMLMLQSIDIALDASDIIRENNEEHLLHLAVIPDPESYIEKFPERIAAIAEKTVALGKEKKALEKK